MSTPASAGGEEQLARARRLHATARRMRELADELDDEATAMETAVLPFPLRGRDIAEAAYQVLADGQDRHYTDLLDAVQRSTGRRVAGRDPAANLLGALDRDDRIARLGARSGRYTTASEAAARLAADDGRPHSA